MNRNEIAIKSGSGFFYEKETQYLVQFSNNKYDWSSNYFHHLLIIPSLDHPLHQEIIRHEVEHAIFFHFFNRNKFMKFLWFFLFADVLFGGFEEIWVSYKSKTLKGFFKSFGNVFQLFLSCFLLFCIIYGIFYSPNILFVLLGVYLGLFIIEKRVVE